jgi:hypothetical protein
MAAPLKDQITSRGHWRIRIFPTSFAAKRVREISELRKLITRLAIEMAGLPFPSIGTNDVTIGTDWIAQEYDLGEYRQAWRFYQSTQLVLYEAFIEDWLDHSIWKGHAAPHGSELSVSNVITTFWQVFEFGARLATAVEEVGSITVSVHALELFGRNLRFQFRNRHGFRREYVSKLSDYRIERSVGSEELVANPALHAVDSARELFARFGWDADAALLRTLLSESGAA